MCVITISSLDNYEIAEEEYEEAIKMVMLCGRSKLRHAWDESRQQRGTTFSYRFSMIKGLFNLTPHLCTTEIILIILLGLSW